MVFFFFPFLFSIGGLGGGFGCFFGFFAGFYEKSGFGQQKRPDGPPYGGGGGGRWGQNPYFFEAF